MSTRQLGLCGLLRGLALGGALLLASTAHAQQGADDASRAAARELGYEGVADHKAGRHEAAAEKLGRAFDVVQVPTLGLWLARALDKSGKLVEAYERYGEVTRLTVTEGKADKQQEAQATAKQEQDALLPRIPRVRIKVEGAAADQVAVTVDGVAVPSALVGTARMVNPGARKIEGKLGEQVYGHEVTLAEGETKEAVLRFQSTGETAAPAPATDAPPAAPPPAAPPAAPPPGAPEQDTGTSDGSTQRTVGWLSLGLGGAGLGAGGVMVAMLVSKKNELDDGDCLSHGCGPDEHDKVDSYNSLRPVAGAALIVGGVGVAAGVTLLLTAPSGSEQAQQAPAVTAWVGPGSVGVRGRF